jgi:hypothetical protein
MSMMAENLLFVRALHAHLDRLEDLLGDNWPTFQQRMRTLLKDLVQADSDTRIQRIVDNLIDLGLEYAAISDLIRALLNQAAAEAGSIDMTTRSVRMTDPTSGETREVDVHPETTVKGLLVLITEVTGHDVIAAGMVLDDHLQASYVTFTFTDVSLGDQKLKAHEGLLVDHEYRLEVGIGLSPDSRFGDVQPQPPIRRPDTPTEIIDLYVTIFTRGAAVQVIGDPLAVLKWPVCGPSQENAVFVLKATSIGEGALDVYIYHKTNLLYTAGFRVTVQSEDYEWDAVGRPITWRYQPDEDKNRSLRFQSFACANQLVERGLNLVIQRGSTVGEYLITALMGRAQLPARVEMTSQEHNVYLVQMRSLLDRLRREAVYIEGGYNQQGEYVGSYTGEPGGYNAHQKRLPRATEVFNTFMQKMAQTGSQFSDALFRTDSGQVLRAAIREHLQPGDIIQIWIDRDAHDFIFPWAWLYDSDPIDSDYRFVVQNDRFWGYRYIIEQLPQFVEQKRFHLESPIIPSQQILRMKIGVYNFVQTSTQKQFFATCSQQSQGILDQEVWEVDKPWEQYLPQCDSQILHFFTHGHTAKPVSHAEQQVYDMLAQWKVWLAQPIPDETPEMQAYRQRSVRYLEELTASGNLLSQTFIKLTRGHLLVGNLRQMRLQRSAPLVFLNMCESAQVFPDMSDSLIDNFLIV